MNDGWIKIHRQLLDWQYWKDAEALKLWLWLLLNAQHEEYKHFINTLQKEVTLKPGQVLASVRHIAKEVGIHREKTHRLLKAFKKCDNIETDIIGGMTCVTIINWEEYQNSETIIRQKKDNLETILRQEQEITPKGVIYNNISSPEKTEKEFEENKPPKKTKKKAEMLPIPDEYPLTEYHYQYASKKKFTGDLEEMTEDFIDWHKTNKKQRADYTAAWRMWLRKSIRFSTDEKTKKAPVTTYKEL